MIHEVYLIRIERLNEKNKVIHVSGQDEKCFGFNFIFSVRFKVNDHKVLEETIAIRVMHGRTMPDPKEVLKVIVPPTNKVHIVRDYDKEIV